MSADSAGSVERELKLGATPDLEVPDLTDVVPGVQVRELPTLDLDATYLDTPDLRLVRAGVSLRRRTGEGDPRWTLKLPAPSEGGALVRRELDVVDAGDAVPARLAELVTGWVRSATLGPVIVIRSHRRRLQLVDADGRELAELDDDDVTVVDGDREVGRFREIEVELAGGSSTGLLQAVGEALTAAGAGAPDPTSKVQRGLGARADAPADLVVPTLTPAATVAELVAAALVEPVGVVVATDHVLRLDDDPDGVRKVRSALRRWRHHLSTLSSLLDADWAGPLREAPRPLLDALAEVRRTDAVTARLLRAVGALPSELRPDAVAVVGHLEARRAERMAGVQAAIAGPGYVGLLDQLVDAATAPRLVGDPSAPAARVAPGLVGPAWSRLHRSMRALDHHPDITELMSVRSPARRVQLSAALVAPVVGEPAALLARATADLGDVLAAGHQAHRAVTWLSEVAPELPSDLRPAATALAELQQGDIDSARHRWRDAWAVCDRSAATGWLA